MRYKDVVVGSKVRVYDSTSGRWDAVVRKKDNTQKTYPGSVYVQKKGVRAAWVYPEQLKKLIRKAAVPAAARAWVLTRPTQSYPTVTGPTLGVGETVTVIEHDAEQTGGRMWMTFGKQYSSFDEAMKDHCAGESILELAIIKEHYVD